MTMTINVNGKQVAVSDIHAARDAWVTARDANGWCHSALARGTGNVTVNGVVVAHVSYNGRMWEGPGRKWSKATREIK